MTEFGFKPDETLAEGQDRAVAEEEDYIRGYAFSEFWGAAVRGFCERLGITEGYGGSGASLNIKLPPHAEVSATVGHGHDGLEYELRAEPLEMGLVLLSFGAKLQWDATYTYTSYPEPLLSQKIVVSELGQQAIPDTVNFLFSAFSTIAKGTIAFNWNEPKSEGP